MKIRPRNIVEKRMSHTEIVRYREGCKLRAQLQRIVTPFVLSELGHQIGIVGENLDEVVAFALTSWLHSNAEQRHAIEQQYEEFRDHRR